METQAIKQFFRRCLNNLADDVFQAIVDCD